MVNIGTWFLALDTRRLAVGRKATATALHFSLKLDVITDTGKRGREACLFDVNVSVRVGGLASVMRGIKFAVVGLVACA